MQTYSCFLLNYFLYKRGDNEVVLKLLFEKPRNVPTAFDSVAYWILVCVQQWMLYRRKLWLCKISIAM